MDFALILPLIIAVESRTTGPLTSISPFTAPANTADAAALELQKLLPLWSTTTTAQVFLRSGEVTLTPAENLALQLLETTTSAVYSTRHRLAENKWFGSSRLRVVDETLR